jgi:hypothetical protein
MWPITLSANVSQRISPEIVTNLSAATLVMISMA